jgi:hypothetical protein
VRALVLLLIAAVGCGADRQQSVVSGEPSPLPSPPPPAAGWSIAEGPGQYDPNTLYEYLNGGAERYQALGFRRLVHLRYQRGGDPMESVALDIYDMGSELGAFGIYSAGRPRGVEVRPWGAEGYRSGTIAAAYRGNVYVHGEADDDRPELLAMLEDLMATVADSARGPASPPAVLASLPATGRVPGSERYVAADLLGHSFLGGGVLAEYEIGGARGELFFGDLDDDGRAGRAFGLLRAELEGRGASIEGSVPLGQDGFRYTDPVMGSGSVVRSGGVVAGAHGQLPTEARERLLGELIAALESEAE